MPTSGSCARSGCLIVAMAAVATLGVSAQSPAAPEMPSLLARVGGRIEEFYKRVQSLVCVEKVTAQPIRRDMAPEGFARVLEYDLRVEMASADDLEADANFARELRKVNGHAPRKYDLDDRNTCLDPNPITPEPLSFLLSRNRGEYVFTWVGFGKGKDANTLMFDYRPVKTEKAQFLEDEKGREDCFQIALPTERTGRVWVNAVTYEVLRIEQHLAGRVDVRIPWAFQRKKNLPDLIVVD